MNLKLILIIHFLIYIKTSKIIDLNEKIKPPKKTESSSEIYNIVIMGTNDIHGAFFPKEIEIPNPKDEIKKYKSGGLIYMGKYISILQEEWGDRFLWLDAGDQFQGSLESKFSDNKIITEFFNIMKLNGSTIGNHEWDYGIDVLKNIMNISNFEYIVDNIYNSTSKSNIIFPNQVITKIFKVGEIKVGIIGLVTIKTPNKSTADFKDVKFLDYKDIIIKESAELRKKTDVIVLLSHFGIECYEQTIEERNKYNIYNKYDNFTECDDTEELFFVLKYLTTKEIDVIISGHTHFNVHQFFNDIPVISNLNEGVNFNLMYLNFKKDENGKYKFLPSETLIEGPIPICEKIFSNTLRCDIMNKEDIEKAGTLHKYKFHNVIIEEEEKLLNLSLFYKKKYDELSSIILTKTDNLLEHIYSTENALSNFILESLKIKTNSDIAILNSGIMKSKWNIGNISIANIYQMLQFDSDIITFNITGYQLKKLVYSIQKSKSAIYPISGLKQIINKKNSNSYELISFKLYDGYFEREVNDNQIYKIVTNNYCYPFGGGGFKNVIKWLKVNWISHGDIRDFFIEYLKKIPIIISSNYYDQRKPNMKIINKKKFLK